MSAFDRCVHCGGELRGYAGVETGLICHPDTLGLDCYRLVTVYHHETPCFACEDVRRLQDEDHRTLQGGRVFGKSMRPMQDPYVKESRS